MSAPNDIILFHYPFSPFARRVIWYLTLRGIEYGECIQPPVLPRPDLAALGVNYRRIPVLSIGRDVYCDTRLILQKLEEKFPTGALGATGSDQKAIERLLESWTVDSGVFTRAATLIPSDLPAMKDPKFLKDREGFSGRPWKKEALDRARPEALAHIRNCFALLETTLLADGRDWVLQTEKPSLADIEAIWPLDWLVGMKGSMPEDVVSERLFPKVYAWIHRFRGALKAAKSSVPKPVTLKGPEAVKYILNADLAASKGQVDPLDPLGLRQGEEVEVYPTDSGFSHRDRGRLVTLMPGEVTLASKSKSSDKEVYIHVPRTNFRVSKASEEVVASADGTVSAKL